MDDLTLFRKRLIKAREDAGYSDTYDDAAKAVDAAEKRGWGRAPSRSAIHQHETTAKRIPGGDVIICYAAAYEVNPVYLLTGRGVEQWNPGLYERDSRLEMLAQVRRVARWMLNAADEKGTIAALLTEDELPPKDERPDGKDGGRSVGTPRRDTA